MSSYRQILYHIIFRTKEGKNTLIQGNIKELYAYIHGIIKNKNCILYSINGMEDHIHFLSDLHPSIALADYMRDIKASTSFWIKKENKLPHFEGWAEGYAALTYAWRDKEMIKQYIIGQQDHHKKETFMLEYRRLLEEHGIIIDERFFP
ncbi:MAG: IS200/IS605 family transposase [Bacteroidales bacterium]|nr:IS200/IS605 family transposase [Bacteroidales bacterium]